MRNNASRSDRPKLKGRRASRARTKRSETIPDHRERTCKVKIRFSCDEAQIQARKLQNASGYKTEPYSCRFGDHWHIGRVRRRLQDGVVMLVKAEKDGR